MRRPLRALALALLLLLAAAPAARASDVDQFGFGARPIAMGNAFTALATDWTGAYYNPAAPALSKTRTIGAMFSYVQYALDYQSESGGNDAQVERQTPLSAISAGIASPLSTDQTEFLSRITGGIGLFLPTRAIVAPDVETAPGSPQFFLYGSRRDKLSLMPFVSARILPIDPNPEGIALSVGVGATLLSDISGHFTFDLSASAARSVATDLKLAYDAAPNFGVYMYVPSWLSLGVAYRGELSLKADFDTQIIVDGSNLFPLKIEAVTLFQPQQVAFGAAVDPLDWLTIALDLTWANWSAYNDAFVTIRPVIPQADVGFKDIVIPRVGLEGRFDYGLAARCGYYFQPTPIPRQTGATNLIDGDKNVLSFGLGWTLWTEREKLARDAEGKPTIVKDDWAPLSVDAFIQWHMLERVRVEKDPGASPQTGSFYEAGGDAFNFGIQITIRT